MARIGEAADAICSSIKNLGCWCAAFVIRTPLERNPTQVDYADYRAQDGVKVPFQWTLARPLGRFTIQVPELPQNVPVDDKKFEKPPAPTRLPWSRRGRGNRNPSPQIYADER